MPRNTARLACTLAAWAVLLLARPARAENTARLVYLHGKDTESCPPEIDLHDAVAARLGYEPFSTWALDTLFVEVEHGKSGFVARVKLVTSQSEVRGAREIATTGACADLMSAMALTISLVLDPMAPLRKGLPEGVPPGEHPVAIGPDEAPREPIVTPPPDTTPETPPEPRPRPSIAGGVGTIGSLGAAPGPAFGLGAFVEGGLGSFRVGVEGRWDFSASTDANPGRVSSAIHALSLVPCAVQSGLFACPSATVGEIRASGVDITTPRETGALYAAFGGRLGYEIEVAKPIFVRGHLGADIVATRYALQIAGAEAFRYPLVSGTLVLSVGARWP